MSGADDILESGSGDGIRCAPAAGADHRWTFITLALILISTSVVYALSFTAAPLLDEQFILGWLGHGASSGDFWTWTGPDLMDAWGPLAGAWLVVNHALWGGWALGYRVAGLLMHMISCLLLYLVVRRLYRQSVPTLAIGSALLFAVYPLHPEAVSWIGGSASLLSTLLFLCSFYCYLTCRNAGSATDMDANTPVGAMPSTSQAEGGADAVGMRRKVTGNWPAAVSSSGWYLSALLFYALSVMFTVSIWTAAVLLVAYELIQWLFGEPSLRLKPLLSVRLLAPFVLIAAASSLAFHWFHGSVIQTDSCHDLGVSIYQLLRNTWLPINQVFWHGYSPQYRFLYLLLLPLMLLTPVSLLKDRALRRLIGLALFWYLIAALPFAGHAVMEPGLYGSRWLYLASAPLCIILAAAVFVFPGLSRRWSKVGTLVSALVLVVLCVFYARHAFNQVAAWRVAGKVLSNIQKSATIAYGKEQMPFIIVRDIPEFVRVEPAYSVSGAVCLDGPTTLLSAGSVPGGLLKSELRQGHFLNRVMRWDKDFQGLFPIDTGPVRTSFGAEVEGNDLVGRLRPPINFYQGKSVVWDASKRCLVLETNAQHGPAVSFKAEDVSCLDGDFLVVNARIKTPSGQVNPHLELYWLTRQHDDYNHNTRMVSAPVVVNDGQFHTYFLPLRTIGWVTSGGLVTITLGFPPGARVFLKQIGIVSGSDRLPQLTVQTSPDSGRLYTWPFYSYPQVSELGLARCQALLKFHYALSNVVGACSGLVEVSHKNHPFSNPNGGTTGESLMLIKLTGLTGDFELPANKLQGPGVYQIRVIAVDKAGVFAGNFSDSVHCLVN